MKPQRSDQASGGPRSTQDIPTSLAGAGSSGQGQEGCHVGRRLSSSVKCAHQRSCGWGRTGNGGKAQGQISTLPSEQGQHRVKTVPQNASVQDSIDLPACFKLSQGVGEPTSPV